VNRKKTVAKVVLVLLAGAAIYVGVRQGEWAEAMFNATLL
jgi:hypothetical protein